MHWTIKGNSARVLFEPSAIPLLIQLPYDYLKTKSKERCGVLITHRYEHMLHSLQ